MDIEHKSTVNTNLNRPNSIFVSGNYAYTTNWSDNKLSIFDLSNPALPVYVASTNTAISAPYDLFVSNDYAYVVSDANHRLVIFDVSNPNFPICVSTIGTNLNMPVSVYVSGNYAYVTNPISGKLTIFDVSNPSFPSYVSNIVLGGYPWGIYVSGNYAYVTQASAPNAMVIIDVTNPAAPVSVSSIATNLKQPMDLYVSGNYAYVTSSLNNRLVIFNISNPVVPTYVSEINTSLSFPLGIFLSGNYVYVASVNNAKLVIFDISNPAIPTYVTETSVDLTIPEHLYVSGNYIYVVNYDTVKGLVTFETGELCSSSSSSSSSWIYSSSSSTSTSSSVSSSSSSSRNFFYRDLNLPIVNQSNYDLLPFAWVGQVGTSCDLNGSAQVSFVVESETSPYLNYSAVIDRGNLSISRASTSKYSTVYVPQISDSEYQHQNAFYVDVIAKDSYGIKSIRTHVEPDKYQFEDVEKVFFIPKFTWDPLLVSNIASTTTTTTIVPGTTTTTTTSIATISNTISTDFENSVWVGTENGTVQEVRFKKDVVSSVPITVKGTSSTNVPFFVNKLLFSDDSNDLYISTDSNIYIYGYNNYLDKEEIYYKNAIPITRYDIASLYCDNVWSVQTYDGKVVEQNASNNLSTIRTYSNFDAPFKIIKSSYHDAYFVAGTHILWKIEKNVGVPVYEINSYSISDFDVSDSGEVSIIFKGTNDTIWRILKSNLYDILLDRRNTNDQFRFCKYCKEGVFYALSELDVNSSSYSSIHYLFDVNSGSFLATESNVGIAYTTTTTTLPLSEDAIKIITPNGGEFLQLGGEHEIQWVSSKSISDSVKIDLIKGDKYYSTLVSETGNTGIYKWLIADSYDEADDYKIRITWLSGGSDLMAKNIGESASVFSLVLVVPVTTTTTTLPVITEYAIGVDYDLKDNLIIFMLRSGLYGLYNLNNGEINGLLSSNTSMVSCMTFKDTYVSTIDKQSKVRIFVGSEPYLSDKWDSGEIETSLTSVYYGGGNNLQPGRKYYVNIQVFSKKMGWSDLQTSEFTMPL